jgi:hypothetical protein
MRGAKRYFCVTDVEISPIWGMHMGYFWPVSRLLGKKYYPRLGEVKALGSSAG